jgi:N-acetylglucosamine-6-phosphate deacetylase
VTDPGYHIEGGVVRSADGTIAGSALRMDEALRNYMSYAQIPFRSARAPRADLSFWDKEYHVIATMVGGRFVYNQIEVAA